MKLYLLFLTIFLATLSSSAQTNRFDFIVGSGVYSTPARRPITPSVFFNGEFETHVGLRWALSAGIIAARYIYEMPGSSFSTQGIPINIGRDLQANFLVKYKIFEQNKITLQVGTGVGAIVMGEQTEVVIPNTTTSYVLFTSITDFGFPLSAELYKKATRRLSYGIKLGSFIFPDYPIIGNNIGIQLRYSLF